MSADYKQLAAFQKKIEKLNEQQKEEFLQACCKELAARLLAKVIKRTPSDSGALRRGWTAGKNQNASQYANSLNITKVGNKYHIDITNPVEYASYVEYGHRTKNHKGWVEGHHMLTISETELNQMSNKILQAKLNKFMKDVFE
jgi:hypothetical protein